MTSCGRGVGEFLDDLAERLRAGTYRPRPLRRGQIPKPGKPGQLRPLGIPCVADRVVMASAKTVLEPVFEADFLPSSYGFRPGLSAHHALETVRQTATWRGKMWVLDADIRSCLEPSSHCLRVHGGGVEQALVGGNPDSEALSAALADVEGVELAALDTLQHGLAGDAERAHGVDDRDVAGGRVVDEQGAQLVVDADAPGGAGGVVLAGDEAVVEPAVQGRGRDAERVGGLGDRKQFAVGWLGGWLVRGDVAVAAQSADDDRGEALAGGAAAALAVEDAGDRGVVVVNGEPFEQRDRVLVGAD